MWEGCPSRWAVPARKIFAIADAWRVLAKAPICTWFQLRKLTNATEALNLHTSNHVQTVIYCRGRIARLFCTQGKLANFVIHPHK